MTRNISKLITVAIVLLGISGCASNSMSPEAKEKINSQTGFNIENIQVKLIKHPFFPEDEKHALYMSTTELSQHLKISLKKELYSRSIDCKETNKCLDIDVNVDYMRTFILASNMLDRPKLAFNIQIKDNQKILHTLKAQELILSRGTVNTMLLQTNIGSNEIDKEREALDFDIVAKDIVGRLKKLTH